MTLAGHIRSATANDGLVERNAELTRLVELLEGSLTGEGAFALVAGEAGIGKTSILDGVERHAEQRGMRALRGTGAELEQDFPYGVVRQLFERFVRGLTDERRGALLRGAAKLAEPVLGLNSPAHSVSTMDGPFAAVHGLYWLAADLASAQPLLLAVDDLHWADAPSVRWLAYMARRLEGVPLYVVVAAREHEPGASALIDALARDDHVDVIRPAPLTPDGVRAVVMARYPAAAPEFCAACHEVTAGNPFYLAETLAAAADDGLPATAQGAEHLASLNPGRVSAALVARIARLGVAAQGLARALAVLDSDATLRRCAELAGISPDEAAELLDRLTAASMLASGRAFEFVHPIARSATYESIPHAERLRLHERAASLLSTERAAPERVARHLMLTEARGSAAVAGMLRLAAAQAQTRGAPDLAARYLRRALDERSDTGEAWLRHDLGLALLTNRDPAAFGELRRAMELTSEQAQREEWSLKLTRALAVAGRPGEAVALAREALARGIADQALAIRLESELLVNAWLLPDAVEEATFRLARLEREALPDELEPFVAVHSAVRITVEALPGRRPMPLLERALAGGLLLEDQSSLPFVLLITLIWNDDLERPLMLCNAALELARQLSSRHLTENAGAFGGLAALRAGRLAEATSAARLGYEIARDTATPESVDWAWALSILLDALRERGELDAAQELLVAADAESDLPSHATFVWLMESRGRVRCAQGRLQDGVADLLEVGRRWRPFRVVNPTMSRWRSDAALALLGLGDREQAGRLADDELRSARGANLPSAIGIALRTAGLVHRREEMLAEAASTLEGSPLRLEYAKALCELGGMRRRASRRAEARPPLMKALDIARRCTAAPLAGRVRTELAAAGARPRRDHISGAEALTPGELRIARMAAAGQTNKEISQALFLTLRTVETHLTHVYRKLDISSRAALSDALPEPVETALA